MRFADLRLIKYGHFDSCNLTFPSGEPDFHIIFGPNEAGKTTTLSAVRDLLFGFGRKTEQAYRFDRNLLRVGAHIECGAHDLVVRRKKGDVRTLLDDTETPLADTTLMPLLCGYDAESFERMFSLDHARLRQGGSEIIEGKGEVGQAIFSAGSGLRGIAKLCEDLETEAKNIWAKTAAQGRLYYVAQRAHEDAKVRLRQAQTKPSQWDTARKEYARASDAVAAAQDDFDSAFKDHGAVERKRRLLLPVAQLQAKRRALSPMGDVPVLPADAEQTCTSSMAEIATSKVHKKLAGEAISKAEQQLSELQVPDDLVSCADEVEAMRESKVSVADYIGDLPKRRASRDTDLARLEALQSELGWPKENASATRHRIPARTSSAELSKLIESRAGLEEREAAAQRSFDHNEDELNRLTRERNALGDAIDVAAHIAEVRRLRGMGDLDLQASQAVVAEEQLADEVEKATARLAPWQGSAHELGALAIPSEEEVSTYAGEIAGVEREVLDENRAWRDARQREEFAKLAERQALEAGDPILPEMVAGARHSRDETWSQIREKLIAGERLAEPVERTAEYEAVVAAADQLADRRAETSEATALAITLRQSREEAELEVLQAQQRAEQAEARQRFASDSWTAFITPIHPQLSVKQFLSWRTKAVDALATYQRYKAATKTMQINREAAASALSSATEVATALDVSSGGRTLPSLLTLLDVKLDAVSTANAERTSLDSRIQSARVSRERAQRELDLAKQALTDWEEDWVKRVTGANLGSGESYTVVRARLALLEEVREVADRILGFEQRITSMEDTVRKFGEDVDELASRARVNLPVAEDPTVRLAALHEALSRALTLDQQRTQLRKELEQAEAAKVEAYNQIQTAEARLKPLLSIGRVQEPHELLEIIERSSQARTLQQDVDGLEAEVLTEAGGGTLEDLIQLVEGEDADALRAESDRITAILNEYRDKVQELSEEKKRNEIAFRELDDGPNAAIAAADMAQARAEMEFHAETYIQRRSEAVLLRWATERYRRERQAPLLKAASDIFSRLTIGRYSGLDIEVDGNSARLIGLLADGISVVPAQSMSDGTADQLYLSLRLAAVTEAVNAGAKLPFIADDLFINYDDERAAAGFRELSQLAGLTQVLFFTHHEHLLDVARKAVAPLQVSSCSLASKSAAAATMAAA